MPDTAAIAAGLAWEQETARRWRARVVAQSGAGMRAKLDVAGRAYRLSLKWTRFASFRVTAEHLRELRAGTTGPGGKGGETGIMLVRMDGLDENVAIMLESDLLAMQQGDVALELAPSRRAVKRAAGVPALRREA